MTNVRTPAPVTTLPTTPADLSNEPTGRIGTLSRPASPATAKPAGASPVRTDGAEATRPAAPTVSATPASAATVKGAETVTPQLLAELKKLQTSMGVAKAEAGQLGDVDFAVSPGALFPSPGSDLVETYKRVGVIMASDDLPAQRRVCAALSALYANDIYVQQRDAQTLFHVPYETATAKLQPVIDVVVDASTSGLTVGATAKDALGKFNIGPGDVNDLVQWVIREGYLQTNEDLKYYAEKVRLYNDMKKAVRDHLNDLRKLQSSLAGVKDDDKAKTNLAGVGPSTSGTNGSGAVAGGTGGVGGTDPAVTGAADRAARFPDQNVAVAEFMGLCYGSEDGRTKLEDYLDKNPDAKQRFLAAIPYMTSDELMKAMRYLYGKDMNLCDNLKSMDAQIAAAMTPTQVLEFAQKTGDEWKAQMSGWSPWAGAIATPLSGGEFETVFAAKLSTTKAWVQSKTGNASDDIGALLGSYKQYQADEKAKADAAAAAAAQAQVAQSQATASSSSAAIVKPDSDLDMDASDGSIDSVQPTTDPPYLMKTGEKVDTVAKLDTEVKNLEEKLNSIGDDAQLANVDLQNILQKQQQSLQMMSNISKMLSDTALAIIRKIGG